MNPNLEGRRYPLALLPLILTSVALIGGSFTQAQAAVMQSVETVFTPGNGAPQVSDSEEIFGATSSDINTDILATVGRRPPGGPGYAGTSSAGRFGQVGLEAAVFGVSPGSSLRSSVFVASDEFVNIFGGPASARTQFIVDGGRLIDLFSTDTTIRFKLQVGAENQGVADPIDSPVGMSVRGQIAAGFGAAGLLPGGGYTVTLSTDSAGNRTFSASGSGGLDLQASFDPNQGVVEIPLSLQSVDLGTLNAGDRLLIGYTATIEIIQNGVAEGLFAGFSDPLTLSGTPNPIFGANVIIEPLSQAVPESGSTLVFLLAGGALLCFSFGRGGHRQLSGGVGNHEL